MPLIPYVYRVSSARQVARGLPGLGYILNKPTLADGRPGALCNCLVRVRSGEIGHGLRPVLASPSAMNLAACRWTLQKRGLFSPLALLGSNGAPSGPARAAGRWLAGEALEGASRTVSRRVPGLNPSRAACRRMLSAAGVERVQGCGSDRPLDGGHIRAADVRSGSASAGRVRDLTARKRSSKLCSPEAAGRHRVQSTHSGPMTRSEAAGRQLLLGHIEIPVSRRSWPPAVGHHRSSDRSESRRADDRFQGRPVVR